MHVGVFAPDIGPDIGGGYTFVRDLTDALLETAADTTHRFTLFCRPDYADHLSREGLPANISAVGVRTGHRTERLGVGLRHLLPALVPLWRWRTALVRASDKAGIELMWFLGGAHDTLERPYIATVWDVQHRTHPWFPEVSAKGRWEYREAFLSRHLRRASFVITGTSVGRDELSGFFGIDTTRVRILPHPTPGFALKQAEIADNGGPPLGITTPYLLYPAQFWPHKNHINLLHGLKLLKERRAKPPALALVGSDKGNRAYVERVAAELGVSDLVRFLGFVSVDDLVALYRHAAALVYPSFSGPENLPPLEAFALGCPVIASEFPGAREQLEDAALFFDPMSPDALATAAAQLLDDPQLGKKLVERGRSRARRWTGRDYVRGVFSIIDEFAPVRRSWPS